MKKTMLLVLMINWFQLLVNAQDVKIEWGKPNEKDEKSFPLSFFGVSKGFIYLFSATSVHSNKTFIEKYDEKTNALISNIELKSGIPEVILNETIVSFYSEIKDGKISYGYYTYNDKFEKSNEKKQLLEADENLIYIWDPKKKEPNYFYRTLSYDKKQMLFYRKNPDDKTIEYFIVDEKFNVSKGAFKYESNLYMKIQDAVFTDNSISFLIKEHRPKEEWVKSDCYDYDSVMYNYNYSVWVYNKENKTTVPCKLILKKENYVIDIYLMLDANKNIVVAAAYKEKQMYCSRAKGIFCTQIDSKTNTPLYNLEYDFPEKYALNFISKKQYYKNYGIGYCILSNLLTKDDGSLILIFANENRVQNEGGRRWLWTGYSGEIMPFSISKKGEVEWSSIIPKRQAGDLFNQSMYVSFIPVYANNNLYLIYNENLGNMNAKVEDDIKGYCNFKKSIVAMATVNCIDGTWKKEVLFDNKSNGLYLTARRYFKLNKNEIIIHGQNDKTVVLGRLKY